MISQAKQCALDAKATFAYVFNPLMGSEYAAYTNTLSTQEQDAKIIGITDVYSPWDHYINALALTTQKQVYMASYPSADPPNSVHPYLFVQDPYASPPIFLDIAALADTEEQEIHAFTLASNGQGGTGIIDWFGTREFIGAWTVIPILFAFVPGGRMIAASYAPNLKERGVLVATQQDIQLIRIRHKEHIVAQEDFSSFSGEKIVSLTSFYVPDDDGQHVVVATTNGIEYIFRDIIYYQSGKVGPLQLGVIRSGDLNGDDFELLEISGYINPDNQKRHVAIISNAYSNPPYQLYRSFFDINDEGFLSSLTRWPGSESTLDQISQVNFDITKNRFAKHG